MNKKTFLLIAGILILLQNKAFAQDEWLNLELGQVGPVNIQLKVKKYACAADTNWIGFEFNNTSQDTLYIERQFYADINYGSPLGSSSFSNNGRYVNYSEFLKINDKTVLLPGITSSYKALSNDGSFHFGLPEQVEDSLLIDCILWFNVKLENYPTFEIKNYHFTFKWYYPSYNQLELLKYRLEKILSEHDSIREPSEDYFYYMLLETPKIASKIPAYKYLTYLKILDNESWVGYRSSTVEYLDKNHSDDTTVLNYFRNAFNNNDYYTALELDKLSNISPKIMNEILNYFKRNIKDRFTRNLILDWYNYKKEENELIKLKSNLFFNELIAAFPIILASPDTLTIKALKNWAEIIPHIEQIGDTTAIPYLIPYLENKTKVTEPSQSLIMPHGTIVIKRIRVCDYALEAIYNLRGLQKDFKTIYLQYVKPKNRVFESEQAMKNFYEIIEYERDNLIRDLLRQLKKE